MLNHQQKTIRILEKQVRQKKISHAYLFVGKQGTEMSHYLAKTILCESQSLGGCGGCGACLRVGEGAHADLQVISGSETSIKKEDVLNLKHNFVQSSVEKNNHQVYIIEDADNATPTAMNALLKYLEEPEAQTTAILSTLHEGRILETIQSRCLTITLSPNPHQELYDRLILDEYDMIDAFYLSHLCESQEAVEALVDFNEVKDMVHEFMGFLRQKKAYEAMIYLQVEGIKQKKLDREKMLLFCSILEILLSSKSKQSPELSASLENVNNIKELLESVIKIHDRIRPGVNIGLIIDQLVYEVMTLDKTRKF